jgi:alpha(1,3/1,4) fucosyltransferase
MNRIKLKFQNGLNNETFLKEVFEIANLTEEFYFEESQNPDFVIFGPYGNDIPPKGNYIRIGYFCENITPDMSICEWAFGVPHEQKVNNPRYKRIQWHGLNPAVLLKNFTENDIDRIAYQKNKFCNFLYSHPVFYREEFFKQLSKYKKVDAPGKSMNNMASIDSLYQGDIWERKRKFLSEYKFTIAFENYAYPGYQTEKLYDAMQMNSLPIYCGDKYIQEIFNTQSFLNVPDYIAINHGSSITCLENLSQMNFTDIRPQFYKSPKDRIQRKLKSLGRDLKMKLQFNKLDFSDLIDQIILIDKNPELYLQYLKEPWFKHNQIPENLSSKSRWIEIFNSK